MSILVKLKDATNALNEVVVVGYGTQRKPDAYPGGCTLPVKKRGRAGESFDAQYQPGGCRVRFLPVRNLIMMDGKPIQSPVFNIRGTTSIG